MCTSSHSRCKDQVAPIMPRAISIGLKRRHLLRCRFRRQRNPESAKCGSKNEAHLIRCHIASGTTAGANTKWYKETALFGAVLVFDPASRVVAVEIGKEIGPLAAHGQGLGCDYGPGGEVVAKHIESSFGHQATAGKSDGWAETETFFDACVEQLQGIEVFISFMGGYFFVQILLKTLILRQFVVDEGERR